MHVVIVMENDTWETHEWMGTEIRLTSGSLAKTSELIRSLRDDEAGEVTGTRDAQSGCAFTMRANGRS